MNKLFFYWVPSALSIVANFGALKEIDVTNIKTILFAGETMPAKQLNIWRKYIPNALYANLFGPTEITDIGVYYVLNREFDNNEPIPIACDNVGALGINSLDEVDMCCCVYDKVNKHIVAVYSGKIESKVMNKILSY